jgi:hypothetical protein
VQGLVQGLLSHRRGGNQISKSEDVNCHKKIKKGGERSKSQKDDVSTSQSLPTPTNQSQKNYFM